MEKEKAVVIIAKQLPLNKALLLMFSLMIFSYEILDVGQIFVRLEEPTDI